MVFVDGFQLGVMNTSNAMGLLLMVFGVVLAVVVGLSASREALVLGFVGAAALFYMGIGLYSRGNTDTGLLRTSGDRESLRRTAGFVAALAAAGALLGFGVVTVRGSGLFPKLVFGVVFLYNLPVAVWLLWESPG